MLPFLQGEILSEITHFEPSQRLEEDFAGAGMEGHLSYRFLPQGDGTKMIQRETLRLIGPLRILEPVIERMLAHRLILRLEEIKRVLESGWPVNQSTEGSSPGDA
jgi:hypothetical protein